MSWLKRLLGDGSSKPKPASTEQAIPTMEELNRLIPAFGQLMERNAAYGVAIFDETMLPAPKSRLEFVIFCAVGIIEDNDQAEQVAAGLLHLADYQPNVGPVPITLMPLLPDLTSMRNPDEVRSAAEAITNHGKASRYAVFEAQVQQDLVRLSALADKARSARANRRKQGTGR